MNAIVFDTHALQASLDDITSHGVDASTASPTLPHRAAPHA